MKKSLLKLSCYLFKFNNVILYFIFIYNEEIIYQIRETINLFLIIKLNKVNFTNYRIAYGFIVK